MKAISSIFSSLIVTLITISLAVPLFVYFSNLYNNTQSQVSSSYNALQDAIDTQITLIRVSNNLSGIFVYNYGQYNVTISKIIIYNVTYNINNFVVEPLQIVSIYTILNASGYHINIVVSKDTTIVLLANNNYYYFT
ncbi:pilin subunit UpsB [Stygiolobus azoricus]|uniref:Uncharacterized protein n=1 Tax=Stygiolobus azoricus TaxID=41675 RepID=A0A650CNI3_9CREN|nr:archaellin/type IV pilin N-terminal domain-containing protein [Stygiolobus azoricus]QGR19389.1 hypothetical protein D1868_04930 [Stygiolobus azoricus]